MKLLTDVLKKNRLAIVVYVSMAALNWMVCWLYGISAEPLAYAAVIAFTLLAVLLAADYLREKKARAERVRVLSAVLSEWRNLREAQSLAEEDYQRMVAALGEQIEKLSREADASRQDMLDYYTTWVHQIKTPLAVMRLKLSDDTPEHRELIPELSRMEQYVDMVLQYIRIGSGVNDLVIREYPLDELIREAVRKQATQFVDKRLKLDFSPTGVVLVTDQKWFSCILDQLLSNAVKYTPSGSVAIAVRDGFLTITDTGIGIAKEDLPLVFEKGYTGANGRLGKKSSGLGLYLAKKAADLLSIPISVDSTLGCGCSFRLDIRRVME